MKAKALRIIALVLLALLTTAAPCVPPDPAYTVYVVHGGYESGHVVLSFSDDLYSDRIDGSLTLQFSRDGAGNVVLGPLTLAGVYLSVSVDGLGSIEVSLDAPTTSTLLDASNGVTFSGVPLTAHLSVTCSTLCEQMGIPVGTSEASVPFTGQVTVFPVADHVRGFVNFDGPPVSVDLGLGAINFYVHTLYFRGSTSIEPPE